jgi:hypothetical protein
VPTRISWYRKISKAPTVLIIDSYTWTKISNNTKPERESRIHAIYSSLFLPEKPMKQKNVTTRYLLHWINDHSSVNRHNVQLSGRHAKAVQ